MTFGGVPQWIILPWLFAFGACIGSFLNVCIYRIPQRERLWDRGGSITVLEPAITRRGSSYESV